ncbi:hypothetical protein PR202_gb05648 [Eleusine coracana subsp. coracana]|uniref:Uncharacterized protein n=1 Tax=Eleusine coracana subsp. coracana TaxID=191504 RepID=A0AAV5E6S7_ELECO|nr:hypothetical protein PR202_gb05648 [Eleusine coracana subsp. coracana]
MWSRPSAVGVAAAAEEREEEAVAGLMAGEPAQDVPKERGHGGGFGWGFRLSSSRQRSGLERVVWVGWCGEPRAGW